MSLIVYTARISSRDPDRLDITRKSGDEVGKIFAPSWKLLRPALKVRERAVELQNMGTAADHAAGLRLEEKMWAEYAPAYLAEMRVSYVERRPAWDALLARPRVVLVCYCADALHCHRFLLAEHILRKLGADVRGETV